MMTFNLQRPCLVGVVHLGALPGSPGFEGELEWVVERAVTDAVIYRDSGFTGIVIENFGDLPFFAETVGLETVAAMARVGTEVRQAVGTGFPLGFNVLRNDAASALGLCAACDGAFIRVNVHAGAMVTDQGVIEGKAAETLRLRRSLGREGKTVILADVMVKHASPLGSSSLAEAARDTFHRGRADALIVTGSGTGETTPLGELELTRAAVPEAPLFAGSGVDVENVAETLRVADGVIVGSSLKREGVLGNPVDPGRAAEFVEAARS